MTPPPPTARADERASALILVPTMFLVLMTLGALAVDSALMHSAHRSVHRIVAAAADDAAATLDDDALYLDGELRIDADRARNIVLARLDAASMPGIRVGAPRVEVLDSATVVKVAITVEIPLVLGGSVPGRSSSQRLEVSAAARLNR